MTRRPVVAGAVFVLVLTVLGVGAFCLQQMLYREPPVVDLTPRTDPPAAVAAPVARPVRGGRDSTVPQLDPRWVARTARAAGIPEVALSAYARAELQAPAGCGLGWTTLAGIGWVESHHGTIGERTLLADGRSSSPILGPALDGVGPVAAIPATPEGTALHGDPRWDHALGPMQFLTGTWESWGADGDGDGVADPFDLDDAALAAARYLCADGRDLTTGTGWSGGVLSYNRSEEYLLAVHAAAVTYADRA